ncbi:MAG: hypothetical protein SFV21_19615 [Rhodospirillaceae bacterium]|nr:hypothetical protein [Rhodospirillaceae bacterium]
MPKLSTIVFASLLCAIPGVARAAPIFTDWTAVDFGANTASGMLGGVSVSFNVGDTNSATINGTSTIFSNGNYSPPLTATDHIEVIGNAVAPYANSVTFGGTATDIIIHIQSLASTLTFTLPDNTPIPVLYVSGSIGAGGVVGNQVIGQLFNGGPSTCPTDVCGTVMLLGTFSAFNFTSLYHTWPGTPFAPFDGIGIQIGASSVAAPEGVPAPGALALLAVGLLALSRRRVPLTT